MHRAGAAPFRSLVLGWIALCEWAYAWPVFLRYRGVIAYDRIHVPGTRWGSHRLLWYQVQYLIVKLCCLALNWRELIV